MESDLKYKEEESYGVLTLDPSTEAEYYALRHWLDHARNCGLPMHMIELKKPSWLKNK